MIKFTARSLAICVFFAIFHIANASEQLNIGKFFGGCADVSGTRSIPRELIEEEGAEEAWYTNRVLDGFLPWTHLRCQSSLFRFKSSDDDDDDDGGDDDQPWTVKTQFSLPILPFSFEIRGTVEKLNPREYKSNYRSLALGNTIVPQTTTALLQHFGDAALAYTCLDFKLFHFDTLQVISEFKSPAQKGYNESSIRVATNNARRFGVSPASFLHVDQSC